MLQSVSCSYICNNARLCSLHFKNTAFSSTLKHRLLKFAVPYLMKDTNQALLTESLDCISKNSENFPESNGRPVEKANISSSHIEENSITDVPSSKTDEASLNSVSTRESVAMIMSPSETNAVIINKIVEKTLKMGRDITRLTKPDLAKITIITLCCTESKEGIAFHKLMQDSKHRMHWISAIKSKNSKPSQICVLCPKHFSEDQTVHHSALNENTAPNIFALDALNQQDIGLSQTWKEVIPVNQQDIATEDGNSKSHEDPEEIKKIYVKVVWDDSVTKIAKKMSLKRETIINNTNARKKLKSDEILSPSDISSRNHLNFSIQSPQKDNEELVNHTDVKVMWNNSVTKTTSLKTGAVINNINSIKKSRIHEVCTLDTKPRNHSNLPIRLSEKDNEKLINHTDASKELQIDKINSSSEANPSNFSNLSTCFPQTANKKDVTNVDPRKTLQEAALSSPSDTNASNFPNLPINLSETINEKLVNNGISKTSFQKDTIMTATDISHHTKLPIRLPQKTKKQLVKHARIKQKKDLIDGVKNRNILHSPNDYGVKRMSANPLSCDKKKLDPLCPCIIKEGRNLTDCTTQIESTEIKPSDSISNIVEERMSSNNSNCDTRKEGRINVVQIESTTQTESTELQTNDSRTNVIQIETATQTESTELQPNDSVNSVVEEEMSSINSYSDSEMETRTGTDVTHFPKIVNVVGGIDPFKLQQSTETDKQLSHNYAGMIKIPNEWWGIACTPEYVICSKWNKFYDRIFRVIIENDGNVKIFIKDRECTIKYRKVSVGDISDLLQEVDSYEICAGIDDKSMTKCMGYLENGSEKPFSIWCKGCQKKGKELIDKYKWMKK